MNRTGIVCLLSIVLFMSTESKTQKFEIPQPLAPTNGMRTISIESSPVFVLLVPHVDVKCTNWNIEGTIPGSLINTPQDMSVHCCCFHWNTTIAEAGHQLARAITRIKHKVPQAKIVVVADGEGSLVTNVASTLTTYPLDVVIQCSIPINGKNPLPQNIGTLFSFYSKAPPVNGRGQKRNGHKRYSPLEGTRIYNIRVLSDGSDPLTHNLLLELTQGHSLFKLCASIQQTFSCPNLIVNRAQWKQKAHGLCMIKPFSTHSKTDTAWKKIAVPTTQEQEKSDHDTRVFVQAYHKQPDARASKTASFKKSLIAADDIFNHKTSGRT